MTLSSILASITMDDFYYQLTGMVVVFSCLIFLSLILTVSGTVAVKMDESRKAKAAAAKAAADAAKAATAAPAAATPAAPAAAQMSPADVAALAAGIYDTARSSITPELVAVIAAAVRVTLQADVRILSIQPSQSSYTQSGRSAVMNSHFPKRG